MRVLVCHVRYTQPGGEDVVFEAEVAMLRGAGLEVATLDLSAADLSAIHFARRVSMALHYADHDWGREVIREAVQRSHPDVVHFHNIYPQLGAGAIAEADRLGCATVQTLHNYRLSCLTGRYVRQGRLCESCRPRHFGAGVRYGCYRGSRAQSVMVARASARQWRNFVEHGVPRLWIVLSDYVRDFYVQHGAPAERIIVKANSVSAGLPLSADRRQGVFCGGRLSPEKGIVPFIRAWPDDAPMLTVAGSGPSQDEVRSATKRNVRFLGQLGGDEMRSALRLARVVAMPSVWPEPSVPLVALEAFAEGTPVVAFAMWSLGAVVSEVAPECAVSSPDFGVFAERAVALSGAAAWQDLSERSLRVWRDRYHPSVNRASLLAAYDTALTLRGA